MNTLTLIKTDIINTTRLSIVRSNDLDDDTPYRFVMADAETGENIKTAFCQSRIEVMAEWNFYAGQSIAA